MGLETGCALNHPAGLGAGPGVPARGAEQRPAPQPPTPGPGQLHVLGQCPSSRPAQPGLQLDIQLQSDGWCPGTAAWGLRGHGPSPGCEAPLEPEPRRAHLAPRKLPGSEGATPVAGRPASTAGQLVLLHLKGNHLFHVSKVTSPGDVQTWLARRLHAGCTLSDHGGGGGGVSCMPPPGEEGPEVVTLGQLGARGCT